MIPKDELCCNDSKEQTSYCHIFVVRDSSDRPSRPIAWYKPNVTDLIVDLSLPKLGRCRPNSYILQLTFTHGDHVKFVYTPPHLT